MRAEILQSFPLFASLEPEVTRSLAASLSEVALAPTAVLFQEGGAREQFYLVLDGEVEIIKSLGSPDERLLAVRGAGTLLGEMSLFSDQQRHTASVRARSPVTLLAITRDEFNDLIFRHPQIAYNLLRIFSRRLDETENVTIADLREKNRQLTLAYQELQAAQAARIEKERLETELRLAGEIQRGILPPKLPKLPGWDFGALMIPARQVGGDYYDFVPLADGRLAVVVGDVCDKGMPAALYMALSYSAVRTAAARRSAPGPTLRDVNQHLTQNIHSNMYVTLVYGILNPASGRFAYARGGHPYPLLLDEHNRPLPVPEGRGQPVGMFSRVALDEQEVIIPPGGQLLIYSDGLSETLEADPHVDPLALPHLCASAQGRSAQDLCQHLWTSVGAATPILDDFTVVVCRRLH